MPDNHRRQLHSQRIATASCNPGLNREGRLYYSRTGYVRQKHYLDESKGVPVQDEWADISSLSGSHTERLGYPTQKPEALLPVSYTHLRAHETRHDLVCRLLLEKKKI